MSPEGSVRPGREVEDNCKPKGEVQQGVHGLGHQVRSGVHFEAKVPGVRQQEVADGAAGAV